MNVRGEVQLLMIVECITEVLPFLVSNLDES